MRIVITGGGTGGHVFPAIAVAHELRKRLPSVDILYIGKRDGFEQRAAEGAGLRFHPITVAGWTRVGLYRKPLAIVKLAFGSVEAFVALVRFRPHAVFGTGGYVSFPVVVAAVLLRVPTVIHEQNRYPGLANRILSRLVRRVVTTYEDETGSFPRKKCRLTGMPLRQDIVRLAGARVSPAQFGLDPAKCTLFLLGGSQGAHSLNIAMIDAISLLDPARYQVIFMTGKDDREMVKERLRGSRVKSYIAPFFEDIAKAYAACDIVICRAGASTLAEITLFGLPAILVPYPYAARGHQEANSRVMVEAGAATMILNKELDGQKLARLIEELASDLNKLAAMSEKSRGLARPHAASEIVDMILDAASRKH